MPKWYNQEKINRLGKQWQQSTEDDKNYIRNKVTQQYFQCFCLYKQKEHKLYQKLVLRSIYTIPCTPKVIKIDQSNKEGIFGIQTIINQKLNQTLRNFYQFDWLIMFKNIFTTLKRLYNIFGPFRINQRMIEIKTSQQITLWHNQYKINTQPSFPLQNNLVSQKITICQVFNMFHYYIKSREYLKQLSSQINNFQFLIHKIQNKIKQIKIKYQNYSSNQSEKHKIKNTFNYLKQSNSINSAKNDKKSQLPNFLKKIMEQNQINSRHQNHRKTLTIQNNSLSIQNKKQSRKNSLSRIQVLRRIKSLQKYIPKHFVKSKQILQSSNNSKFGKKVKQQTTLTQSSNQKSYLNQSKFKSNKNFHKFQPNLHRTKKNQFLPNHTDGVPKFLRQRKDYFPYHSFKRMRGNDIQTPKININEVNRQITQNVLKPKQKQQTTQNNMKLKTLQQQMNDIFSNTSRSPRMTLQNIYGQSQFQKQFANVLN